MKKIYLDHASATPLDPRVKKAMAAFLSENFGNPSSIYESGRAAKCAVQKSRESVAKILGSSADEIIFTGSGTESDALAVLGVMRKNLVSGAKGHFVTSAFEHHAVLNNAERLKKEGFRVSIAGVTGDGFVAPESIKRAICEDTVLVSVMYANNEIGTIQDIAAISKIIKKERQKRKTGKNTTPLYLHTDACQASQYLDLNVRKLGVDLLTLNGSKMYGPKGVGILYVRRGVALEPFWEGGGQERRIRSGTENVAGIVGIAEALKIAREQKESESKRLNKLRDYCIKEITSRVRKVILNGHPKKRLPNNVNVSILDIEGEAMLLYLDHYGIEASTGSACDSATLDPSHVILALGKPYEFAHASMRFTFGRSTTKKDIDKLLKVLPKIAKTLRKISPVNIDAGAKEISNISAFVAGGLPHWERRRADKVGLKNITQS